MVQPDSKSKQEVSVFDTGWGSTQRSNYVRIPHAVKCSTDKLLTINISGKKFKVWSSTLDALPDTLLGNQEARAHFYDSVNDEYFFDRDPEIFRHVQKVMFKLFFTGP